MLPSGLARRILIIPLKERSIPCQRVVLHKPEFEGDFTKPAFVSRALNCQRGLHLLNGHEARAQKKVTYQLQSALHVKSC